MPGDKKAILLDLDGVTFKLVDHFGEYGVSARLPHEISIVDGLTKEFDALVAAGFVIVGVTNQPDVSRGKITQEFLDGKHAKLQAEYPQIARIYACTHTETDLCNCRKPKPGLLLQAAKDYDIDFSVSWMVGDSRSDVEAGVLAHAKTIFLQTPYNCADPAIAKCTAVAKNIKGALRLILALEDGAKNTDDA